MAMKMDNIHYNFREIDGYQKPFNFVMSAREPGKTTNLWVTKIYGHWKKEHKPWIYLVRTAVEITEALIDSIFDANIRKFTDDELRVKYPKGEFKTGIVDVCVNDMLFFRIVSLSLPLRRIKLAVLKDIGGVAMDEYIIDPKSGEKYIKEEAFKIKEAYSTWRRESKGILKCYFLGNPYSLFNPLFVAWGVETNKLKRGCFYVGDTFVIQWATLNPKLREKLLKQNPLYAFDEDYKGYALDGEAKNDKGIRVGTLKEGFFLRFVFKISNHYIGLFRNPDPLGDPDFFAKEVDVVGKNRTAICFDFADMVDRTMLIGSEERLWLARFKTAFRLRRVEFESISIYYFLEEIYTQL